MANQPPPSRPWMRLGSMRASPPPPPQPAPAAPTPAPETQPQAQVQAQAQPQPQPAPAPAPAPATARPIVRPAFGQRPTTQPQQPPPPSATAAPPPFRLGSISVPSSPIKTTTSVPTSPAKPGGTSSMPPSPVQKGIATLSSVPTSPVKTSAPSSTFPTSPTTKVISTIPPPTTFTTTTTTSTTTYTTERATEPAPQPAFAPPPAAVPQFFRLPARTTPPAEKAKPAAPPPSPLTLPPAQPKSAPEPIEQKTVVIEKPKSPFKPSLGGLKRDTGDTVKPGIVSDIKDQKGNLKKLVDSDDPTTKIITLAGDNTGAVMELSPAGKKLDPSEGKKTAPRSWWGQKLGSDSSSSDEEKSKNRDKAPNKLGTPSPPMNAFMNSNVQAVNNSILFNTSCHHHDPGVHVFFHRRGGGGRALHLKDGGDGQDK